MANDARDLSTMSMAELREFMADAARRVLENAAATSEAAGLAIKHADRAIELARDLTRPAAEVRGIGDGRDVVTVVEPQGSPAREVELAARAALGAGLDPIRAAMRRREVILDRLLARLAS